MIQYLFGSILFVFIAITYKFYIQPRRKIAWYSRTIKELGYKVLELPFEFFGTPYTTKYKKMQKLYGDSLYMEKHQYPKYDLMISNSLSEVLISFINPDLIREVFAPQKALKCPKITQLVNGFRAVSGQGIVFSEGDSWKKKRKIISKVFNFELLKLNTPKICQVCDLALQEMEQISKQNYPTKASQINKQSFECYILQLGTKIFTSVIMKCFLGQSQIKEKIGDQNFQQFVIRLVTEANYASGSPWLAFGGKLGLRLGMTAQIRNLRDKIYIYKSIIGNIIAKKETEILNKGQQNQTGDLIQALIWQREKAKGTKQEKDYQFSHQDLLEEFGTFLLAGTDTTAHYFMMMVYYLCDYPEYQKKVRQQIDEAIPTSEDINFQNLKKLKYIDWLQLETTRYYGPGTSIFMRMATVDLLIGNIPISKGTCITIQPLGAQYSEKNFKNPLQFRPQRWESECDELHPFAVVGFGGGPRNCLGKHLAMLETKIAIVKLLKRYASIQIPSPKNRVMKNIFFYEPDAFNTTFFKTKA